MTLINLDLLKNPANWVIVWSMIAMALILLAAINQVQIPVIPRP